MLPPLAGMAYTLTFAVQRLIANPEIMLRCQKEIDEHVGRGRLPTLDDRIKYYKFKSRYMFL